jgi:hypothetical protein
MIPSPFRFQIRRQTPSEAQYPAQPPVQEAQSLLLRQRTGEPALRGGRISDALPDPETSNSKEPAMNTRRFSAVLLSILLPLALSASAGAAVKEIKGAAILDHPCGKVAVKHMGLVHAGKMAEAVKLGTPQMQEEWNKMPAEDREMMSGMMKEMSKSEKDFSAEIKAGGLLVIDGDSGTLTVKKEHKDANGSGSETMTQRYKIDGSSCWITR